MIIDRHISRAIGDDLIVTSRGAHRVFVLNPPAKFIWERMCNGVPTARIPEEMVKHFGIEPDMASRDFESILSEWRRAGLVPPDAPRQSYLLAGVSLTFYFSSPVARDAICPLFRHLEIKTAPTGETRAHVDFEIRDVTDGYEIISDGITVDTRSDLDGLLESVTAKLVDAVHDQSANALSLHSAAIGDGCNCVLMPGRSGSGKSTLTAALVAAGYSYFTDDTVLLDDDFEAIPLPSPLVLKGEKWPGLAPILPDIAHLPIYERVGTDVRYWSPPQSGVAQGPLPVCAIVFPTFKSGQPFHVEELSPSQTLERIVGASCMIRAPIDDVVLDELIAWLEKVPSYAMTYGALSDPMAFVTGTLRP